MTHHTPERPRPPELEATLHPKGSPAYNAHVATQQEIMRAHLERVAGRALTSEELALSDSTVADAIAQLAQ